MPSTMSDGSAWEGDELAAKLASRVRGGWGAYWVAGGRVEPPPVPPISLTGGIPDPDTLPTEELIEVSNRVLRREGPEALRYGGHQGYAGLREWLAEHYSAQEGLSLTPENFTLLNGASGCFINICQTFLDEGDVGLVEEATFPGSAGTIQHCQSDVVGVAMDKDGLLPEALEQTIGRVRGEGKCPKLLYVIDNFNNPTGATLSLERRHAVVEICRRHDVLMVEDDAYGDIRIDGDRLPTLYALAGGEGAVYMGTFSKTVATGLRVGWVLASEPVIEALLRTRFDLGSSPWLQRVMAEYASSGLWDAHVAKMIDVYRRKRDTMLAALEERCGRYARWNQPGGGFFVWLTLSEAIDLKALADAARQLGVAYVPGVPFYRGSGGERGVRLAFSYVSEREIPEAIQRFGRALEQAAETSAK